jgi:uncharacterized protein YfaS (alpha-2-macroglobulin family)
LVDKLPGGLEIVYSKKEDQTVSDTDKWYQHVNRRDTGVEVFAAQLTGGDYYFTYKCRANFTGEFITPPARAEEMYSPDISGQTSSLRVHIM